MGSCVHPGTNNLRCTAQWWKYIIVNAVANYAKEVVIVIDHCCIAKMRFHQQIQLP